MADRPAGTFSPEITKLSEKLQKDPASKLFFNLAEEYYKEGLLEEALAVLQSGLKSHPTYLSAKVLLGKICFDQAKIKEAKEIFEQVLKVNPDNIVVNKKLAVIYDGEGSFEEAKKCCSRILFFNSKDPDALALLQKISERVRVPPPHIEVETPASSPSEPASLLSAPLEAASGPPECLKPGEPDTAGTEPPPPPVPTFPPPPAVGEATPPAAQAEKPGPVPDVAENTDTRAPEVEGAKEKDFFDFSDIMKEEAVVPPSSPAKPSSPENGKPKSKENLETIALAELYIKQGHYDRGIEIYQKLLEQDPYNETVRQQLEDAKTIGNLLGTRPEPQRIEKNILETIIPPAEQPDISSRPQSPPPLSPEKQEKIDRLKKWLENLKKVH